MNRYFRGRKQVGDFTLQFDKGKSILNTQIFEQWEDIDISSTARCGDKGTVKIARKIGLSTRDMTTLKGSIEASIGVQGIAQLKSQVEATIESEVSWNAETSIEKTFEFSAPECGIGSRVVYQLIRDYELDFGKNRST
jgi:hypothetical protein